MRETIRRTRDPTYQRADTGPHLSQRVVGIRDDEALAVTEVAAKIAAAVRVEQLTARRCRRVGFIRGCYFRSGVPLSQICHTAGVACGALQKRQNLLGECFNFGEFGVRGPYIEFSALLQDRD